MKQMKLMASLSFILSLCFNLSACINPNPSPEARERAREVLEETSPRNLNEHPKVTCPNIGYTLPSGGTRGKPIIYNQSPPPNCE
jgi:hypothetical protein